MVDKYRISHWCLDLVPSISPSGWYQYNPRNVTRDDIKTTVWCCLYHIFKTNDILLKIRFKFQIIDNIYKKNPFIYDVDFCPSDLLKTHSIGFLLYVYGTEKLSAFVDLSLSLNVLQNGYVLKDEALLSII